MWFKRVLLSVCLTGMTATCPQRVLGGDWPMWRYDAERGAASPDELPAELRLQWVRELPEPRPAWPPDQDKLQFDLSYEPVVMGKTIFTASMVSDHVTAYDTDTGEEKWRFYADGPVRFAPTVWHDKVYFVSDDGYLYCVQSGNGALVWKLRGGPSGKKVLGNGRLISAWPARGGPVLLDGTIYFGAGIWSFMGTFIHALDAETGQIIWTNSGSGSVWIRQQHDSPAFAGVAPQGYMVGTEDTLLVSGGRTVPAGYDRRTGEFIHFNVADRAFGKDAGGYAVYARKKWFLNGPAMYRSADGAGVARARASVLTNDAIINVSENGTLVAHALRLEREEFVDRKGKKQTRTKLPKLWEARLDPPLNRVFIKAGPRVYGSGAAGLIAAVDLPQGSQCARLSWWTRIKGDVWNMLAADDKLFVVTRQGVLYCFGAGARRATTYDLDPASSDATRTDDTLAIRADDILKRTGVTEGYCLVLGARSGGLIKELASRSALHIIALDPDAEKVQALRRRLDDAGLYGTRTSVHVGDVLSVQLPPYLASLIVSADPNAGGLDGGAAFVERVFRALRPYGGVACLALAPGAAGETLAGWAAGFASAEVSRSGTWALLRRVGALPGSADWTHQYADPANSVVSGDELVRAPLGLLWFGGPSNARVLPRHGHGPSPQVVGGRLFIEGPDIIRAVDVYTGRLLWETELPGVGKYYNYTSHEPGANAIGSNYVSVHDGVYVAYGKKCLRLDPAAGTTLGEFTLPASARDDAPPEWGYIGVWNDLLIAGARPMSFWEPDFDADEFRKADPQRITALVAAIKTLRNFDVIKKAQNDSDKDFIVKNLNKLLADGAMAAKIPHAVPLERHRDETWSRQAASLHKQIDAYRQTGPGKNDVRLRELNRRLLEHYYPLPRRGRPTPGRWGLERTASKRLVAMNRHNGDVLWTFEAAYALRHNAIVIGDGKVFCIDRLPDPVIQRMKRRGQRPPNDAELFALDARTGEEVWSTTANVFGTWLGYSDEYRILLQAGSKERDRARDEVDRGMVAYDSADGRVIWESDAQYGGPVMLHHDTVITQGGALSLETGKQKMRGHPLTGRMIPWRFTRQYGCSTAIASEHLLTFRSAAAGYYDLADDGGTGNLGGFKSGCTSNLIVANGVLNAPDYTRTCTCSYQNQTSLGLVHDAEVEMWTFNDIKPDGAPVQQVGINFGAPGDRLAGNGTLWLDYPSVGGPSPDIPVQTLPENPEWFRYHASRVRGGGLAWVVSSGGKRLREVKITLAKDPRPVRLYTVRLYFAEPERFQPGQRVFDIAIQGKKVLEHLDIVREAGAPNRGVVEEFRRIEVAEDLTVTLTPSDPVQAGEPILCGLEAVAEGRQETPRL